MLRLSVPLALVLAAGISGCAGAVPRSSKAASAAQVELVPTEVSAEQLPSAVHELLGDPRPSPKREGLLVGVVRRQLKTAARLFAAGDRDAGLAVVRGALYLVREGEAHPAMWTNQGTALAEALVEVSRTGDAGLARALISLILAAPPSPAVAEQAKQHLTAIDAFEAHPRERGRLETAADQQVALAHRSLFEPTPETLERAGHATVSWMTKALETELGRPNDANFDREEALEAYHAVRAGGASLAGLYLRHGLPMRALEQLEKNDLARIVPAALRDRLLRSGEHSDPKAWLDLFSLFRSASDPDQPESSIDREVARAASFSIAIELYRAAPQEVPGVGPLAIVALEQGLPTLVPLLVAPTLRDHPDLETLNWAMTLVQRAVMIANATEGVDGARQVVALSKPILQQASAPARRLQIRPSAGRIALGLAAVELRAGNLARAQASLKESVQLQPSVDGYGSLAQVERQQGNLDASLGALARLLEIARESGNAGAEAEALVQSYEIEIERGNAAPANRALEQALERALDARKNARNPHEQSQAERLLARVLEIYGETEGERRASTRALEASRGDLRETTATLLDTARRALVRLDLNQLRKTVQLAMEADLAADDRIYLAVWLRLAERSLKLPGNGLVEDALENTGDSERWPQRLRGWALGTVRDGELQSSARSALEQSEAQLYLAFVPFFTGDKATAATRLEGLRKSPGIDLIELVIARDLLRKQAGRRPSALPARFKLP